MSLEISKKIIPQLVEGNKSPTLNGMGYIFYTISPLGKTFIKNECTPEKTVLEIGAGYNNIPIEALKSGVSKYVANDLSQDHLQILAQRTEEAIGAAALKRLILLAGKAPTDLPKVQQAYDAILADKVMHFMHPREIMEFIGWAKTALKKGGTIYVSTSSPYSTRNVKLLPEYLRRQQAGATFPGYFTNIMNEETLALDGKDSHLRLPDEMVIFSRQDLIKLFQSNGMEVIASYSLRLPVEENAIDEWLIVPDEQSSFVGITAKIPPD